VKGLVIARPACGRRADRDLRAVSPTARSDAQLTARLPPPTVL